VTTLILKNNALKNITKDDFKNFTDLYSLNLIKNDISYMELNSFEHNKQLKVLFLSFNPMNTVPTFVGLENQLTHLLMSACSITNATWDLLIRYTQLKVLRMTTNALNQFPNLNLTAGSLSTMVLGKCEITFIPAGYFKNFSQLIHLYLNNHKIKVLNAGAFDGTKLQVIRLDNNDLDQVQDAALNISTLEEINLNNNQMTTIPLMKTIGSILHYLDMSNNKLNGSLNVIDFNGLTNLKTVALGSNRLTGFGEAILSIMSALEVLDLTSNNITEFKDPFQWYVGPITHLTIDHQNNPMTCESDLCWAKNNSKITLNMDGCIVKPWSAVTANDICPS
jgi:Leucine-rich repeat (LRR) protein